MKSTQVNDFAGFFADLDSIDSDSYDVAYQDYLNMINEGSFHPYGNMFDVGYERLAFIFALFHEFEDRYLAQSDYMDTADHPNADEVFAFELYESLRKAALRRVLTAGADVDQWNFFHKEW